MDAEYYAIAIYETNKMAKREKDSETRNRLYEIKEDGIRALFDSGYLTYIGSHHRIVACNQSSGQRIRIFHYYRCGSYSFHSLQLFEGLVFHLLGEFKRVC